LRMWLPEIEILVVLDCSFLRFEDVGQ